MSKRLKPYVDMITADLWWLRDERSLFIISAIETAINKRALAHLRKSDRYRVGTAVGINLGIY